MKRSAVFVDRDNTLIEDPGYINDPEQVRLFDDAAPAVARLREAGYLVVVVSNQSGLARGLITEEQLGKVHQRLEELLERRGAGLDGIYFCPFLDGPAATVEAYRRASPLRKPAPGMLLQAAKDLEIDLARSWLIGDAARDVEAGRRAGCRTILLERSARGSAGSAGRIAGPTQVAASLTEAADVVLKPDINPKSAGDSSTPGDDRPADQVTSKQVLAVLTEMRELMDRSSRRRRQEDFSLVRLGGTLLQMLAVVTACWGIFGLFGGNHAAAIARLALACFLQLATLTIHINDRPD